MQQGAPRGVAFALVMAVACATDPLPAADTRVPTTAAPTTIEVGPSTTTRAGQEVAPFRLEPHEENPVLRKSAVGGAVFMPEVHYRDGSFHMWFTATGDWVKEPLAIHHAVSSDGILWTIDSDPALEADDEGFDAVSVSAGRVVEMEDGWVMYYNASARPVAGPGEAIGRATAPGPEGPWTADPEPVLGVGEPGAWDSRFITPNTVVATESGINLYYSGGSAPVNMGPQTLGLARSTSGRVFEKLPTPVIDGTSPWDGGFSYMAAIFPYRDGLAAFYTGNGQDGREAIGYGWSADGVDWETSLAPLLEPGHQPWATEDIAASSVVELPDGRWLLYYSGKSDHALGFDIGVAEIVATR